MLYKFSYILLILFWINMTHQKNKQKKTKTTNNKNYVFHKNIKQQNCFQH